MENKPTRSCGNCGSSSIPVGVDWPLWKDGKPVCLRCHLHELPLPAQLPNCPACNGIVGMTHFKTVSCSNCAYDAGGENDTEADAIRIHMLNCQRLSVLVPVQPPGWKLVPDRDVPEQMWGGLARKIVQWLEFNERHTPASLLEHLGKSMEVIPQWLRDEPEMQALDHAMSKGTRAVIIYKAMLADAPTWAPPKTEPVMKS